MPEILALTLNDAELLFREIRQQSATVLAALAQRNLGSAARSDE